MNKLFPSKLVSNLSRHTRDRQLFASRHLGSNSAAYDGDGKTTVRVLNSHSDTQLNLINTYSHKGFRLSNTLFVFGPIIVFPTHVYSWRVRTTADITMDSLIVFDLLVPKVKMVVIGYGEHGTPYDSSIPLKLKKKGISCEMLPTPHAVTTYNFLVNDAVPVGGAFLPMQNEVDMTARDQQIIEHSDTWELPEKWPSKDRMRDPIDWYVERQAELNRDKGKKKFDE